MTVEIEKRAKALDEGDSTRVGLGDAAGAGAAALPGNKAAAQEAAIENFSNSRSTKLG